MQLHPGLLPLGAPVISFCFCSCFVLFCFVWGVGGVGLVDVGGWVGGGGHLIKKEARLVPVVVFRTW